MPSKPWPELGTPIRVFHKYKTRRFPGAPSREIVKVYDGDMHALVRAGEDPKLNESARKFHPGHARPSKYDRVTLRINGKTRGPWYHTLTMNQDHVWVLLSEAEPS